MGGKRMRRRHRRLGLLCVRGLGGCCSGLPNRSQSITFQISAHTLLALKEAGDEQTYGSNLIRPGYHLHSVDEPTNNRLGNCLSVFDKPWSQRCHYIDSLFPLLEHTVLLFLLEGWLDALQKLDGQGISLVYIRNVAVEARFGVVVSPVSLLVLKSSFQQGTALKVSVDLTAGF